MIKLKNIILDILLEAFIEYKPRSIVVGTVDLKTKKVIGSDKYLTHGYMFNHPNAIKNWNINNPRSDWRYNKENKTLYWWDKNTPKYAQKSVIEYLKQSGYSVINQKSLYDRDEYQQKLNLYHSHGSEFFKHPDQLTEGIRLDWLNNEIFKLEKEWDRLDSTGGQEIKQQEISNKLQKLQKEKENWEKVYKSIKEVIISDAPPAVIIQKQPQSISKPAPFQWDQQKLKDAYIIITTIYNEGRSNGERGMHGILNVIMNRSNNDLAKAAKICLEPKQFSVWNGINNKYQYSEKLKQKMINDINTPDGKMYLKARELVSLAANNQLTDITGGAKFYYNPKLVKPSWSKKMKKTATIGSHNFYKLTENYNKNILKELFDFPFLYNKNIESKSEISFSFFTDDGDKYIISLYNEKNIGTEKNRLINAYNLLDYIPEKIYSKIINIPFYKLEFYKIKSKGKKTLSYGINTTKQFIRVFSTIITILNNELNKYKIIYFLAQETSRIKLYNHLLLNNSNKHYNVYSFNSLDNDKIYLLISNELT
jgi:hypothetical protein